MVSKKKGVLLIASLISVLFIACAENVDNQIVDPFAVTVQSIGVIQEPKTVLQGDDILVGEGYVKRLTIDLMVTNETEFDFSNVWIQCEWNDEVIPFLASQIATYTSSEVYITSYEKYMSIDDAVTADGKPIVWGIQHNWSQLLTSEDDLNIYHGSTQIKLADALKNITVTIYWDGGSQTETIDVSLDEESIAILGD